MADDHDINYCMERQRVQNHFAFYEVHIGHFFTMSMLLSVLKIAKFNPVYIQF